MLLQLLLLFLGSLVLFLVDLVLFLSSRLAEESEIFLQEFGPVISVFNTFVAHKALCLVIMDLKRYFSYGSVSRYAGELRQEP